MAKKLKRGRLTMKEDRQLIAMAATGATLEQAAEEFRTTAEMIRLNAKRLGIQLKASELEEMAAKLLATARKLSPGQDRHSALREAGRFRARIATLKGPK